VPQRQVRSVSAVRSIVKVYPLEGAILSPEEI